MNTYQIYKNSSKVAFLNQSGLSDSSPQSFLFDYISKNIAEQSEGQVVKFFRREEDCLDEYDSESDVIIFTTWHRYTPEINEDIYYLMAENESGEQLLAPDLEGVQFFIEEFKSGRVLYTVVLLHDYSYALVKA